MMMRSWLDIALEKQHRETLERMRIEQRQRLERLKERLKKKWNRK